MADYTSSNTGAVIDAAVDYVEILDNYLTISSNELIITGQTGVGSDTVLLNLKANNSAGYAGNVLRFTDTDPTAVNNGSMGKIQWFSTDTGAVVAEINGKNDDATPDGQIIISTAAGSSLTPRIDINADGDIQFFNAAGTSRDLHWDATDSRLGINVTNPTEALDVLGNANFTGTVTADAVEVDDTDDIRLRFLNASTFKAGLQVATTAGDMIATSAVDDLAIRSQSDILFATGGNTERMKIVDTGVDITGSADAESGVTVTHSRSGVGYTLLLNNTNNGANKGSGIKWQGGGFDTAAIIGRSDATAASADAPGYLTFHTSTDGSEDLAERLRIDSAGRVGIGVSSSVGAPLHMRTGGATNLWLDSSATSDQTNRLVSLHSSGGAYSTLAIDAGTHLFRTGTTEVMRIDSSGQLGVGASSPTSSAHVFETGGDFVSDVLTIESYRPDVGQFSGSSIVFRNSDTNSAGQARIKVGSSNSTDIGLNNESTQSFIFEVGVANTTPTSNISVDGNNIITVVHTAFPNGDILVNDKVSIASGGFQGSWTVESVSSSTQFTASSTTGFDYTSVPTDTSGAVASSTSPFNAMIVRGDGNVGINKINPETLLQIGNGIDRLHGDEHQIVHSSFDLFTNWQSDTAGKGAMLTFSDYYFDGGGPQRTTRAGIKGVTRVDGNNASGGLAFYTNENAADSLFPRMTIDENGKVGIRSNTDAYADTWLHIDGDATVNTIGTTEVLRVGRPLTSSVSFDQYAAFKIGRHTTPGGGFESHTRLDIDLRDNTSTANADTNVMTLLNNGSVGIGTTSPEGVLQIWKPSTADADINWVNIYNNVGGENPPDRPGLFVGWNKSNGVGETIIGAGQGGVGSGPQLEFALFDGTDYTTAMAIDSDGNVGIGNNNPKTTLNLSANNSGQGPILTLENSDTTITTDDVLGQIDFYANDGSTGGTGQKATIQAVAEITSGASVGLTFGTSPFPNTTATIDRLRIGATGTVSTKSGLDQNSQSYDLSVTRNEMTDLGTSYGPRIVLQPKLTDAQSFAVTNGGIIGDLWFGGSSTGRGGPNTPLAFIRAKADDDWALNDYPTSLVFGVTAANDTGAVSTNFEFSSKGHMGINGTANANHALDINQDIDNHGLQLRGTGAGDLVVLRRESSKEGSIQVYGKGKDNDAEYTLINLKGSNNLRIYQTGVSGSYNTFAYGDSDASQTSVADIGTGNQVFGSGGGIKDFGITSRTGKLLFGSNGTDVDMMLDSDADLHVENDIIAFSTSVSDQRLKDDVETLDKSLDKILQLRGVSFTWNSGSREGTRDIGVIAQEVETVIPEIVREKKSTLIDDQPTKTVDYEKLVAVLIEGMKEQQSQIDELREEIQALKGE